MTLLSVSIRNRVLILGADQPLGKLLFHYFRKNTSVLPVGVIGSSVAAGEPEPSLILDGSLIAADLTKRNVLKRILFDFYPDVIINAFELSDPHRCESERQLAWKMNVASVEYLSDASRYFDAHVIHFSGADVFNGRKGMYYEYDPPAPLTYYGRTKLAAENVLRCGRVVFTIIRSNILFAAPEENAKLLSEPISYFSRSYLAPLSLGKEILLPHNRLINPLLASDLFSVLDAVIQFRKQGIFHLGCREFLSEYDFIARFCEAFSYDTKLIRHVKNPWTQFSLGDNFTLSTLKAESELFFNPAPLTKYFQNR